MWSTLQGRFPLRGEDLEWCEHQEHLKHQAPLDSSSGLCRLLLTACRKEGALRCQLWQGRSPHSHPVMLLTSLTCSLSWHSSGGCSCLCHSCAHCFSWGQERAFQCSGGQDSCPHPQSQTEGHPGQHLLQSCPHHLPIPPSSARPGLTVEQSPCPHLCRRAAKPCAREEQVSEVVPVLQGLLMWGGSPTLGHVPSK